MTVIDFLRSSHCVPAPDVVPQPVPMFIAAHRNISLDVENPRNQPS